uniref:Nonstructural protein NS1 n=1 Tax=Cecropis daurica ambidensovirus TaxID=2794443 RepID=A0A8E7G283_9VIRU|nr:MAG: nonstructural protein NS1 [Cecropis daurica ambidensovirus]
MVRSENIGSDSECQQPENSRKSRRAADDDSHGLYGKKSRGTGKYNYIKSQTKALLLKYYCSPVSSIRDIKEFRDNDILSDPKNKDYLQSAFDDFGKDRNDMSLRDIYNILTTEGCKPVFIQSMQYGDIEESSDWIDDLLKFQFDEDDEQICHFLNSLVDVLDKKLPKCNALSVISAPNAGKNFFFDMVFALCLNYGQLGQANKYNVFAFQEAPNKRVLLWNEPNYEASLTDVIKMMMGGDPYTVRVKNQMDAHVRRTPVIILSNKCVPFMSDSAFATRIVQFRWKTAPQLKEIEIKPNPMCLFNIFNKYNIQF